MRRTVVRAPGQAPRCGAADRRQVPPGKLRAEAQRLAIALDWAERRYRAAVRQRRVVRYVNDDGTVTIAAEDQDAAEALAAYARLIGLARAAKRAGAHATLDALRSDISMGLQGHRFTGLHENDIIHYLVAKYPKPVPDEPAEPAVDEQPDCEPTADEPAVDEPTVDVQPFEEPPTDEDPSREASAHEEPFHEPPVDEHPVEEHPVNGESLEEAFFEAELLAQELLDQGFFDDERCTGRQCSELVTIALAMRRSYSRRSPTDHDPDPPPF